MLLLGVLALPVMLVLAVVGLPVLITVAVAGVLFAVLVGVLGAVVGLTVAAIKVALFVLLPIAVVVWLVRQLRERRANAYDWA
jgi:ABC-type polysaccharide/polyol phosphate export permease